MQDKQITALILAGTEKGGMNDDYFENKTRHILPIANKSLIQNLVETLDKIGHIGTVHIKIEEKIENNEKKKPCEKEYKSIFGDLIGNGIELHGQDSLTQRGTFGAVKAFIDKLKNDNTKDIKDIFPLLILYGDTLVEEKFLERIIDQYDNDKEPKIIWGLVKHREKKGDVVTEPIDMTKGFNGIDEKDIIDIFEQQKEIKESYDLLHDTGIMLISKNVWDEIYKLIKKIHPSSHGIFSFTSIIREF